MNGRISGDKNSLTQEIAIHFLNKAKRRGLCGKFTDAGFRKLKEELMNTYEVTEIEAINILNGYHISDYVHKYEIKSGKIIPQIDQNKKRENRELLLKIAELEDELKKVAMENENI